MRRAHTILSVSTPSSTCMRRQKLRKVSVAPSNRTKAKATSTMPSAPNVRRSLAPTVLDDQEIPLSSPNRLDRVIRQAGEQADDQAAEQGDQQRGSQHGRVHSDLVQSRQIRRCHGRQQAGYPEGQGGCQQSAAQCD